MSLPRRPDVDPRALLADLAPDLACEPVTELGEGWDTVVYAVGPAHVLRVAKKATVAERRADADRDVVVLGVAERYSPLRAPRVLAFDADEGALVCTRVPGVPATEHPAAPDTVGPVLGRFLGAVHAVPLAELGGRVGPDPDSEAQWLRDIAVEFAPVADVVPVPLRGRIEAFLQSPPPRQPERVVFCHNDVRDEHVMVDPASGDVVGILDWGDVLLGDPARDFATVLTDFGETAYRDALAHYGDEVDAEFETRVRHVAARRTVEGLPFWVGRGNAGAVALTTSTLEQLL